MVDLDEAKRLAVKLSESNNGFLASAMEELIQELRVAREVVEAAKALDNAIGEHVEDCAREYQEALTAYEQLKEK